MLTTELPQHSKTTTYLTITVTKNGETQYMMMFYNEKYKLVPRGSYLHVCLRNQAMFASLISSLPPAVSYILHSKIKKYEKGNIKITQNIMHIRDHLGETKL